ncbi:hypothetical protein ACFL4Y_03930 [Gemmatimonadota bacterium]
MLALGGSERIDLPDPDIGQSSPVPLFLTEDAPSRFTYLWYSSRSGPSGQSVDWSEKTTLDLEGPIDSADLPHWAELKDKAITGLWRMKWTSTMGVLENYCYETNDGLYFSYTKDLSWVTLVLPREISVGESWVPYPGRPVGSGTCRVTRDDSLYIDLGSVEGLFRLVEIQHGGFDTDYRDGWAVGLGLVYSVTKRVPGGLEVPVTNGTWLTDVEW